jgi:hypothetical protein
VNSKRWVIIWFIVVSIIIAFIGSFNYIVDPYGIYNTNIINIPKIRVSNKMRLIKVLKVEKIKPTSIALGTSRTEYGYDPEHPYFLKQSFNFAIDGGSMYELRKNFEWALKQGNLKKILLVTDYRMFNSKRQKQVKDFKTYFDNINIYKYLFTVSMLKDSILTVLGKSKGTIYLDNGQREHIYFWKYILKNGGHLAIMNKYERNYYRNSPTNYTYEDTGKKSFPDFEYIVKKCYENNITLDIIFGPSHIRQWEALDYYLGYDKWLQWKKDIVLSVNKIAKKYNRKQFRIMDFSVYHKLTAEKVPTDPKKQMKYHWEASHYKNELGSIVLDRLIGKSEFRDFGVELNLENIDKHLEKQKADRREFIDTKKYRDEVFN